MMCCLLALLAVLPGLPLLKKILVAPPAFIVRRDNCSACVRHSQQGARVALSCAGVVLTMASAGMLFHVLSHGSAMASETSVIDANGRLIAPICFGLRSFSGAQAILSNNP